MTPGGSQYTSLEELQTCGCGGWVASRHERLLDARDESEARERLREDEKLMRLKIVPTRKQVRR